MRGPLAPAPSPPALAARRAASRASTSSRVARRAPSPPRAMKKKKSKTPNAPPFAVEDESSDAALCEFYTHSLCPYAHRVSLALAFKRVPHAREHVDLSNKPRWFLQVNPRGLVPVIRTREREVLCESIDLCYWLDASFVGENHPPLMPSDNDERNRALRLVKAADGGFIAAGLSFIGGGWGFTEGDPGDARRATLAAEVAKIEDQMDDWDTFLCGVDPSVADVVLWPFVERFELAMREFNDTELAEMGGKKFSRWMRHMKKLPEVRRLAPDEAKLLKSWRRTMRLDYFDYETADVDDP